MKPLLEAGAGLAFLWIAYSLLPGSPYLAALGLLTAAILLVPRRLWTKLKR